MQSLMASSILISTVVGTIVALKLLLMASRTRQFPELAVGIGLLCYATIGQTSLFAMHAVGADSSFMVQMTLLALRLAAYYATLVGLSAFTWRVFDASSTWRKLLVIAIASTGFVMVSASYYAAWNQISIDGGPPLYARFGMSPQFSVMFAWMALESLRYRKLMQKRQVLGLADPAVTNRFEVWGLCAAASSLLIIALTIISVRSEAAVLGADVVTSSIVTATGLVNTMGWWLTFMPPTAYTNWIRARAGVEAAAGTSNG